MTKRIIANISVPLYNLILEEKKKLKEEQKNKIKSRRMQITMVTASQSLVRKLR